MQTIKFRGKSYERWVVGSLIILNEVTYILPTTETELEGLIKVDAETVGQFIGIEDKNKKEIYVGDIDFHGREVVFGKIGYDGTWNGLTGFGFKSDYDFIQLDYYFDPEQIEITGNIHDNK